MTESSFGILYVVATPIGNLGDMTSRACEVLQAVDLIAAEDTRHSNKLLQHFGINTPVRAYHDHSDQRCLTQLLTLLQAGKSLALISDAGTPLISDPGYQLVKEARDLGVVVRTVPGASALVAALSIAGLPSHQFIFEGFLPAKQAARITVLASWLRESRTAIFYEAPHRIIDCLQDICTALGGDRYVVLARELTKTYETVLSGVVTDVLQQVIEDKHQQRGEFVVLLKGAQKPDDIEVTSESERLMLALLPHLPVKTVAGIVAKLTGDKKRSLYQWGVEHKCQ